MRRPRRGRRGRGASRAGRRLLAAAGAVAVVALLAPPPGSAAPPPSVLLRDGGTATAPFAAAGVLAPGDEVTRCVRLEHEVSDGTPTQRFWAAVDGPLAPFLDVRVDVGQGADAGGGCGGFRGRTTFSGTLAGLAAHPDFERGVDAGALPRAGSVSWRLSVRLRGDDAGQGLGATATFGWELRTVVTVPPAGPPAPVPAPPLPAPLPLPSAPVPDAVPPAPGPVSGPAQQDLPGGTSEASDVAGRETGGTEVDVAPRATGGPPGPATGGPPGAAAGGSPGTPTPDAARLGPSAVGDAADAPAAAGGGGQEPPGLRLDAPRGADEPALLDRLADAARAVVEPVRRTLEPVRKVLAPAMRVAAATADTAGFPVSLVAVALLFLAVQDRLDRSDPKLRLAPDAEEDRSFVAADELLDLLGWSAAVGPDHAAAGGVPPSGPPPAPAPPEPS